MVWYVNAVILSDQKDSCVLYEWNCRVYFHCLMPNNGQDMVQCSTCQNWYHSSCEQGDFCDPLWQCSKCFAQEKKANEHQGKQDKEMIELQKATTKCPVESLRVQQVYAKIIELHPNEKLKPKSEDHIGYMMMDYAMYCT